MLKELKIFPEKKLVEKAKNGNRDAFQQIVKHYEPLVSKTVFGMLGNCAEAEDIGQETFITFYKNLKNFRGDSSVGTYITRIAINLSLNELKRRKRRTLLFPSITENEESFTGSENNPVEQREKTAMVREAIRKLEPKFKSVLVLRLISGYTPEETAEILKVPVGTVFSRLARAQKKLEILLRPFFGGNNE